MKLETRVQNLDVLWIANHNVTLAATLNCCVLHSVIFKKREQYHFLIPDFNLAHLFTLRIGQDQAFFLMVGITLHAGKYWTQYKPFVTEPCGWHSVLINMFEQLSNLKLHFNSVQGRWVKSWFDLYQWKSGIILLSSRGSFSFTLRWQKLALIAFIFILELKLKHVCYF